MENAMINEQVQNNTNAVPEKQPGGKNKHGKKISPWKIVIYVLLGIYTLWILAPFLIILVTSFTTSLEYSQAEGYIWFPKDFSFDGYRRLFVAEEFTSIKNTVLFTGMFNTLWITLIPLCSGLMQSLLVAYVYWKTDFPFKNALFMITVSLMFIPMGAFGFVGYMFYNGIGWTEGSAAVLPMIIPGLFANAGTVFFLRPYLEGIGGEIVEAAKVDGMNFWQIFFYIVIPLSKPALVAQFIFGFVGGYNNYAGALLYLGGEQDIWTLQIALNNLIASKATDTYDYGFKCAAALMAMLPLIVLYLCCQRFFIEGISFGGGKE